MGLKETIKETKDKLEEVIANETAENETALEALNKTVEDVVKDEPRVEDKPEDKPVEEPKVEDKPEEKPEEKTATGYSKDRQARKDKVAADLASAHARIAALEASIKAVPAAPIVEKRAEQEPDPATNAIGWLEWKMQKQAEQIENLSGWKAEQDTVQSRNNLKDRALKEVADFENQLRPHAPDYDDVKNYYGSMLATSIRIVNPKISQANLIEAVNNRLLTRASELLAEGYENPIAAMYDEAKALGYQPKQKAAEVKEEIKPDLDKVAKFRQRNAGMAGSSGSDGEADVTAKTAVGMTNAEFAKLKPEQKKRLFASLR